jgi:hypothetical protein
MALERLLEIPRISLGFLGTVVVNTLAVAVLFQTSDAFILEGGFIEAGRRSLIWGFGFALLAMLPAALLLIQLDLERVWHFLLAGGLAYAAVTLCLFLALGGKPDPLRLAVMLGFGAACGGIFWTVAYARR